MKSATHLKFIRDLRAGRVKGAGRRPRVKPGRELVDGVLHFDGRGPSGYSGACTRPKLAGTLLARPSSGPAPFIQDVYPEAYS